MLDLTAMRDLANAWPSVNWSLMTGGDFAREVISRSMKAKP
jgi:hypothetical protein